MSKPEIKKNKLMKNLHDQMKALVSQILWYQNFLCNNEIQYEWKMFCRFTI